MSRARSGQHTRTRSSRVRAPGVVAGAGITTALVAFLPAASAAPGEPPALPQFARLVAVEADALVPRPPSGPRDAVASPPAAQPAPPAEPLLETVAVGTDAGPGTATPTGGASPLAAGGIPSTALAAYQRAAGLSADCGISWTLIAAIGRVESDHGRFAGATLHTDGLSSPPIIGIPLDGNGTARILDSDGGRLDGDTVYDRAVGPMQFIPTTWAMYDGDGLRDPFDINDAAIATGEYLCTAGEDLSTPAGQARAVFAYNHSDSYVASVLGLAATYAGTAPEPVPTPAGPAATVPPAAPPPPPALDPPPAAPPVVVPPAAPVEPPLLAAVAPPVLPEPPAEPEPAPTPQPEPAPTPQPESTPEPVPEPEPVPGPTPEPVTEPTTPPVSAPAPEPEPSPEPTTPATSAPAPEPVPSGEPVPCGTEFEPVAPVVVDVVDGAGDPALTAAVTQLLTDAGLTLGTVSTADVTTSAIEHLDGQGEQVRQLAEALGVDPLLRPAAGEHLTLVLGSADAAPLVEALTTLAGPACDPAPAEGTD